MPITINGTGTITGVSVGGLPDGIVDTDMLATDAVSAAKIGSLPDGSILQAVQGTTTTSTTANSSTLVDTGLSASITPTAANSKIMAIVNQNCQIWGGLYQGIGFALLRGTTKVWGDSATDPEQYYFETGSNQYRFFYAAINYLDDPTYSVGDTLTYKTQARRKSTNSTTFQGSGHQSTLLLLEVAA